ncbi:MAG: hypothetical protein ACOYL5_11745 [Phototrophicaceae bacterium]|jgi:hypothetical protein
MSSELSREDLLQLAIRTAKQGNPAGAKVMFEQVLAQDGRNRRAMMWMAQLAENNEERKRWLERVLKIDPENVKAKEALDKILYNESASENRTLVVYGGIGAGAFLFVILILTTAWAFWPLR